jgi:subtilase family serine protease
MHRRFLLNRLWRLSIKQLARVSIGFQRLGFISLGALATPGSTPGAVLSQLTNSIELSPLVAESTVLSPTDASKEISVVLVLPLKDPQRAAEFAQRASTPGDALCGKFLTADQFAAAYGADAADFAAVKKWAIDNGLKISTESLARTNLTVRGTVSQFETLFNTQINDYRSPEGDKFYSAASSPTIPNAISSKIIGAVGLTNSKQKAPLAKVYKQLGENPATDITADGSGPGGTFNAKDLRMAYSVTSAIGGTVPETVALFEQGGFFASDVQKYLTANKLPKVPVIPRGVNGSGTGVSDPDVELEAVLDIDMIIGINPSVKEVIVYEDGDYNDSFQVALLDALTAVADQNQAQVLSISYGEDEILQGSTAIQAENQELTQLAAQGITVLASAGDNGAYGDIGLRSTDYLNVADPGAQPLVTCVGGTTLFTLNGLYYAEEVWNLLADGLGATGGGVSSVWSLPSYQQTLPVVNGGSETMRNVPDVAAVGNPATGVGVYSTFYKGWVDVGGTSVSAPIWAGYLSLLNPGRVALGFGRFGMFNATFYSLLTSAFSNNNPGFYLNDIVSGNNGIVQYGLPPGYNAGIGYDNCSGFGSPHQSSDFFLLTAPTQTGGAYPGAFVIRAVTPSSTTAAVSWSKSQTAMSYILMIHDPNPEHPPIYAVSLKTNTSLSGLVPNTTYDLTVYAVNQTGTVAATGRVFFTTTK